MENKRKIVCPYCSVEMTDKGVKSIGSGKLKFLVEKLIPENFSVRIYQCPKCGKLEFFRVKQVIQKA